MEAERTAASDGTAQASCSEDRLTFEFPPVDLEAIEFVVPLGLMSNSHVTPVDHQYFQNILEPEREIDVYSPAAGTVTTIEHFNRAIADHNADHVVEDYRLIIEHSCRISSIFIHVGTLAPALATLAPEAGGNARVDIAVAAGELIGTFRKNVDYNVVDTAVTLQGLLVPEHYVREPWKIHAPDSFAYFTDTTREQLEAKSLRTLEPIGGRFDYDIDGRLVGNWFLLGTNGYTGADQQRYWAGHLAVAYDYIDSSLIVVSLGTFDGVSRQFAVRGNAPDPGDVSTVTGPIAYELVGHEYWAGDSRWDRRTLFKGIEARDGGGPVQGVVLFEVLADQQLRVEIFPGATAAQVDGFTEAALIYER